MYKPQRTTHMCGYLIICWVLNTEVMGITWPRFFSTWVVFEENVWTRPHMLVDTRHDSLHRSDGVGHDRYAFRIDLTSTPFSPEVAFISELVSPFKQSSPLSESPPLNKEQ